MEYIELGQQYLNEAETLQRRIERLKNRLRTEDMSRETQLRLYKELAMLKEMHMECSITGRHLIKREIS